MADVKSWVNRTETNIPCAYHLHNVECSICIHIQIICHAREADVHSLFAFSFFHFFAHPNNIIICSIRITQGCREFFFSALPHHQSNMALHVSFELRRRKKSIIHSLPLRSWTNCCAVTKGGDDVFFFSFVESTYASLNVCLSCAIGFFMVLCLI